VLGGHHASADAEVVLRNHPNSVDYIVIGEGEIAMTEFLRRFPNVCSTPGLAFKHNDSIQTNPPSSLLNVAMREEKNAIFHHLSALREVKDKWTLIAVEVMLMALIK
jgi:radical SAM superfamily enzyme YgiQ (UPF0313 family)